MKKIKTLSLTILRYILAVFIIYAGIQHFLKPDFYTPFVPNFLPFTKFFILISGVVEILLGILLMLNGKLGKYGALGIFLLMIVFLPIHIKDVFVDNPSIGSHKLALIRLPLQFVFIGWSFLIFHFLKTKNHK